MEKLLAELGGSGGSAGAGSSSSSGVGGGGGGGGAGSSSSSSKKESSAGVVQDLDSCSRLLERVAGEVSRLTYLANRGKVRGGGGGRTVLGWGTHTHLLPLRPPCPP